MFTSSSNNYNLWLRTFFSTVKHPLCNFPKDAPFLKPAAEVFLELTIDLVQIMLLGLSHVQTHENSQLGVFLPPCLENLLWWTLTLPREGFAIVG